MQRFVWVVCVGLCLSLAACGGSEKKDDTGGNGNGEATSQPASQPAEGQ